jgi:DNA-binding GntR family transcriptional regulator
MTSAARKNFPNPPVGVRTAAASSGKRLAPLVYDLLKERLLEGAYHGGERLPVEALKAEFGVSKQPIMDALRRLASDGLVDIIPQVGCRVPVYEPQDVTDFFAVFGGMEGAVAGVAALRGTPDQLDELMVVNAAIGKLAADPDLSVRAHQYRVLNRRFHAIVHTMAHSPVVAGISRRMWDMSDLLINTSGVPRPLASAVPGRHEDHERIIKALRERDQTRTRQEMEVHITKTVALIHAEARGASSGDDAAGFAAATEPPYSGHNPAARLTPRQPRNQL